MARKSQSSMELLTVFGIALAIIAIIAGIFFMYTSEAKQKLNRDQINAIGQEMISNIEKMYYLPEGNRITMKANFPEGIQNFTIHHRTVYNGTHDLTFDYLNFTHLFGDRVVSTLFEPGQLFVRFNCSYSCYYTTIDENNSFSYFNSSDYSSTVKEIRVESKEGYVLIDFVR
jgi:hypothetical protein